MSKSITAIFVKRGVGFFFEEGVVFIESVWYWFWFWVNGSGFWAWAFCNEGVDHWRWGRRNFDPKIKSGVGEKVERCIDLKSSNRGRENFKSITKNLDLIDLWKIRSSKSVDESIKSLDLEKCLEIKIVILKERRDSKAPRP